MKKVMTLKTAVAIQFGGWSDLPKVNIHVVCHARVGQVTQRVIQKVARYECKSWLADQVLALSCMARQQLDKVTPVKPCDTVCDPIFLIFGARKEHNLKAHVLGDEVHCDLGSGEDEQETLRVISGPGVWLGNLSQRRWWCHLGLDESIR